MRSCGYALAIMAALALGACQSMEVGEKSLVEVPRSFEDGSVHMGSGKSVADGTSKDGVIKTLDEEARLRKDLVPWHELAGDPLLSKIIAKATAGNLSLQSLNENYLAAKAMEGALRGELFPMVGAGAKGGWSSSKARKNDGGKGNLPPTGSGMSGMGGMAGGSQGMGMDGAGSGSGDGTGFDGSSDAGASPMNGAAMMAGMDGDIKNAGFGVYGTWTIDIFGKKTSDLMAGKYASMGMERRLEHARKEIAFAAAKLYWSIVIMRSELAMYDKSAKNLASLHDYLGMRFQSGHASKGDVMEAAGASRELVAQREALAGAVIKAEKALLALMGQTKDDDGILAAIKDKKLKDVAGTRLPVPDGLVPSTVLAGRSDLMASLEGVKEANARLASAKADMFPRFTLSFGIEDAEVKMGDFPTKGSIGKLVNLQVHLPLLTFGRIKANINARNHLLKAKMREFDDLLVKVVNNVNASYGILAHAIKEEDARKLALKDRARKLDMGRDFFKSGMKDYASFVDDELKNSKAEGEWAQATLKRLDATLELYKNLGGELPKDANW